MVSTTADFGVTWQKLLPNDSPRTEKSLNELRQERNRKIAETDWGQVVI